MQPKPKEKHQHQAEQGQGRAAVFTDGAEQVPFTSGEKTIIHPSTVARWQNEAGQEQGQTVKYNRTRKQTILGEVFYESLQWSVVFRVFRAHETGWDCCLLDGGILGVRLTTNAQLGHVEACKSHREGWEFPLSA